MKRKYVTLFVAIFCIGMLISGGTYAYWTWTSNTNKNVVFSTAAGLENYVIYDEGNSHFVGDFQPSSSHCDGISSTLAFAKTAEAVDIDLAATINMDINAIEENIANSDYVKWAITYGDSNSCGQPIQSGTFKGLTNGAKINLLSDIELKTFVDEDGQYVTKSVADGLLDRNSDDYATNLAYFRQVANANYNMFTVWIWIDNSGSGLSSLSGETLDTNIWTRIDMAQGDLIRPGEYGSVCYDANGGENAPECQTKTYGETLTLNNLGTIPTRDGYTFAGWSTEQYDNTVDYNSGDDYTLNKSMTLYAVWTPNTYTITLDGNGATNTGFTTNLTAAYGSTSFIPAKITLPKKEYIVSGFGTSDEKNSTGAEISSTNSLTYSYVPTGWWTSASNGVKVINAGESPSYVTNVTGYTNSAGQWIKQGVTTLYAQWSDGEEITLPTITKAGYTCGWTASSTATTFKYPSGYKGYKPTADRTMYGVCESGVYKIIANVNSCSTLTAPLSSVDNGWTIEEGTATKNINFDAGTIGTLPTASKVGHKFGGWFTDNGTEISSVTVLTEELFGDDGTLEINADCTEPNKVLVKFNVNGGTITPQTTYNGTTYDWTTTEAGTIKRNDDYQFFTINYGESRDLPNADGTYMNVLRTGYGLKESAEWICLRDDCTVNDTYSDTGTINASDLCDLTNEDCEVTLGVNWDINKVLIKFNVNGGTITPQTTFNEITYNWTTTSEGNIRRNGAYVFFTIGYGESKDLPNADGTYMNVTKTGYVLSDGAEWMCLQGDCTVGTTYSDTASIAASDLCDLTSDSCDLTLGLNWSSNNYSINYELEGGTLGENSPTSANYAQIIEIPNPTREGYKFNGWVLSSSSDVSTAKCGNTSTSLSSWNGSTPCSDLYFSNLTSVDDATVTLTANWVPYEVRILFNVNGGTITPQTTFNEITYNWTTTSEGNIRRNGANVFFTIDYGESKNLPNYDSSYMIITKTGNHAIDGEEWKCISGNCVHNVYDDYTSYTASDLCSEFDSEGKCQISLGVNWELNWVTVKFNVNDGNINNETTYNDSTYYWDTTDAGTIRRSIDQDIYEYDFFKIKYGDSRDLPNYDGSYMTIYRDGYDVKEDEEWICLRDDCTVGTIYVDSDNVEASDLCDVASSNCEVTLGVNWKPILNVSFDLNGGETSTYTTVGRYSFSPIKGTYKLEAWGAQGGTASSIEGGYGGYAKGKITVTDDTTFNSFYITVGGVGSNGTSAENYTASGGYNGGGDGYVGTGAYPVSGGGGASHIATSYYGLLKNYADYTSDLLLVAGGGGGAGYNTTYTNAKTTTIGHGGGYVGVTSKGVTKDNENMTASGGKQNEIGNYGVGGAFGQGADAGTNSGYPGGGGGLYGGNNNSYAAGGGSGYIGNSLLTNKVMYCYNCTTSTNANTLTNSTTNVDSVPTSNYAKSGNGAVKITVESVDGIEVTSSKTYEQLPYPSRDGYEFTGWNTKEDGSGTTISNGDTVTLTSDHTLYAQWTKSTSMHYSIKFGVKKQKTISICSESLSCYYKTEDYIDFSEPIYVELGEEITLPSAGTLGINRIGYRLIGWAVSDPDATEANYAPGDTVVINNSLNFFAVWAPYEATVRLDVNADNVNITTPTIYNGTTYNWTTTAAGTLKRNGNTDFLKFTYNGLKDLPNSTGSSNSDNLYMKITRTGYVPEGGAEWKCINGDCTIGDTYSDEEEFLGQDFCSLANGDCTVNLGINWSSTTKYLYDSGNEYKSVTGGWEQKPFALSSTNYATRHILNKEDDYMIWRVDDGAGTAILYALKKIDLEGYDTLGFSGSVSNVIEGYDDCRFGIYSSVNGYVVKKEVKSINICDNPDKRTFDVSAYSGSYYVGFVIHKHSKSKVKLKISKVYLK